MIFKPYPKYKSCTIQWLNEIPQSWKQVRVEQYLIKKDENIGDLWSSTQLLSLTQKGIIEKDINDGKGKTHSDYSTYQAIDIGDLVFCLFDIDETPRTVGLSTKKGMITSAYTAFKSKENINTQYLYYFFESLDDAKALKPYYKGLRKTVRPPEFLKIHVPFPPKVEQVPISQFLDTETARIDNLISKQEKLIELLEEQRKSIISHAVTKGLNPNAPMKDSGVEWLGDVPEHWKIGKLKRWFNTLSGGTPNSYNYAKYYKNGTHPWLRTTDLNNGILTSFEIGITDEAIKESSCKYVPEDSVLIAMYGGDGTIGKNALLKFKSTINQAICALIPNSHFNPEYTFFYIQFYRPYWMVNAMGGRKDPNINQQQIQDAYFVLPPFDEQNKIVDFLKKEHSRIDSLVLKQNQLIEKMKEYRASIISHAVTGKIDVRHHASHPTGNDKNTMEAI